MNNLKEIRNARGMSQTELNAKSNVPVMTISVLENNNRGMSEDTLRKLCKALKCSSDKLLGITPRKGWIV